MPRDPFGLNISPIGLYGSPSKPKKKKGVSFTEKAILWERDKRHICHICRLKIHSQIDAEVDHVKAFSRGGQRLRWAHRACNRVKGNKSLGSLHRRWGIKVKPSKRRKTVKKRKNSQEDIFGLQPIRMPRLDF